MFSSRVRKSLVHGALGNLMEDDSLRALRLHARRLNEMPGDGLTLAVGVGSQEDFLGPIDFLLEVPDRLALVVRNAVGGSEVILDVNRKLRLEQVTHVADRRLDHISLAEEAAYGAGLRRRLDDDELPAPLGRRGDLRSAGRGR